MSTRCTDTAKDAQAHVENVAGLQRDIDRLKAVQHEHLQSWAALVSPWKVGDVLDGQGYTFTKSKVRVLKVIGRLNYDFKPKVEIVAQVLRKDGGDSLHKTDWTYQP